MNQFNLNIQRFLYSTRYLTIYKLLNCLNVIVSYLFSHLKINVHHNIYPLFISIETTNYCNLRCPECPVGSNIISKKDKSSFNIDLYKKLIEELKPTLLHVILYFQGEPFLNNHFIDLIKQTHSSNIYSSTSTNGQFLNDTMAREIVLSGLDKLIVSIDGSTQEIYENYRVGGKIQNALDGIKSVIEWKKALKSFTPLVEIQFLVLKTNEHQMNEMKKLAKSLKADRLTFKSAQLYDFENGNDLLTTKRLYTRYIKTKEGKYKIKGRKSNRCWRLWSGAVINVHGEVLPCCFDKSSEHTFGNLDDETFLSCWQSKNANYFRNKIISNRKQIEICNNCTN